MEKYEAKEINWEEQREMLVDFTGFCGWLQLGQINIWEKKSANL